MSSDSDPTLKVLIISAEYPPRITGGLGTHVGELATGLSRSGCQVTVLCLDTEEQVRREQPNLDVHQISIMNVIRYETKVSYVDRILMSNSQIVPYGRKLITEMARRPDIIHCHDWHYFTSSRELGREFGVPVIGSVHILNHPLSGWWWEPSPREIREQEKLLCLETDALIAVSQSMKTLIKATHRVPDERVHVVYNGFDPAQFVEAASRTEEIEQLRGEYVRPGEKVVLFAGRLNLQKGISALLASATEVLKRRSRVRYLIAGGEEGLDHSALSRMLASVAPEHAALQSHVTMLGKIPRDRLALFYQLADIAVVPSIYEPFGYAAVEAMAAGAPVVATKVGGLAEIIKHGTTGMLVPVHWNPNGPHSVDVNRLAEAQLALLNNEALASQIGKAGQRHVLSEFTLDRMIRSTIEVYKKTISSYRTRTSIAAGRNDLMSRPLTRFPEAPRQ